MTTCGGNERLLKLMTGLLAIMQGLLKGLVLLEYSYDTLELIEGTKCVQSNSSG
jgi:hypothetical protein